MAADDFPIDSEISANALDAFGVLGRSALTTLRAAGGDLVPNFDNLRYGDVILSRNKHKKGAVEAAQLRRGFAADAARYSHAMLYVGELHVIESRPAKDGEDRDGTRLEPITAYFGKPLIVCRNRNAEFDRRRMFAVRYSLIRQAFGGRPYDRWGALRGGLDGKRPKNPELENEIVCTDLMLEAFAVGAKLMVDEYAEARGGGKFFYPADFFLHPDFERLTVTYRQLAES